jgi:hypothetical protein
MSASTFSARILVTLLAPFWWGIGLLVVALLGDLSAWWRGRASRLFNRLEGTHSEPAERAAALPSRHAA